MATVLLASELGTGPSHCMTLLMVARRLREAGQRPLFALRDTISPTVVLHHEAMPVLQAPVWRPGPAADDDQPHPSGYADRLGLTGFDDPALIGAVIERWRTLLEHMGPALVVCHDAPGLMLAARGRMPVVVIGDGFSVPPANIEAFPVLWPDQAVLYDPDALLAHVNAALGEAGDAPLPRLPAVMEAEARFACVLPGLDPYDGQRTSPALGPIDGLPPTMDPGSGVFIRLRTDFHSADAVLSAVSARGLTARAVLHGISKDFLSDFNWPGIELLFRRQKLVERVGDAALIIHGGGPAITMISLALGRPQVILPNDPTGRLTGERAAALGAAVVLDGPISEDAVAGLLGDGSGLGPPGLAERAAQVARDLAATAVPDALDQVAGRCLELLGGEAAE